MLAARLRNQEFTHWIALELNGYNGGVELPSYRIIDTFSLGHFTGPMGSSMKGVPIPPMAMPEEFRDNISRVLLRHSCEELAHMASSKSSTLHSPWLPDLVAFCQRQVEMIDGYVLAEAHLVIPVSRVRGALDAVRNRILDFTLALEDQFPTLMNDDERPKVDQGQIHQLFKVTVTNGNAIIGSPGAALHAGGITISQAVPPEYHDAIRGHLRELSECLEGSDDRAEAASALARVESEIAQPTPKWTKLLGYLQLYASLVGAATPTVEAMTAIFHRIASL